MLGIPVSRGHSVQIYPLSHTVTLHASGRRAERDVFRTARQRMRDVIDFAVFMVLASCALTIDTVRSVWAVDRA